MIIRSIGSEGRITEEGLNTVFNGNLRRIPAHMLNIAEEKIKGLIVDWGIQYPPSPNKERPALGISKAKIAICECRFADGASYNAHMESIHGIQTTFKDEIEFYPATPSAPPPPMYPDLNARNPAFPDPTSAALEAILPLVQAMKSSQERYIPLTKLRARPGKKEVQDGKTDFLLVLKNAGRYNSNLAVQGLADFGNIMDRLKELVDENDMEDLRNCYRRVSEGKSFEKSHEVNMKHLLEALSSIVNKNSGEQQ